MKKVSFFPLTEKIKRKFTFFWANTKNISSHVLKILAISLVLRTREFTDIFNTFVEIYLIFTYPLYALFTLFYSIGVCGNLHFFCYYYLLYASYERKKNTL